MTLSVARIPGQDSFNVAHKEEPTQVAVGAACVVPGMTSNPRLTGFRWKQSGKQKTWGKLIELVHETSTTAASCVAIAW